MYCTPGPDNSSLINTEKAVPNSPENRANIRYNVPISLAFDDKNHLSIHKDIFAFITDKLDQLPSSDSLSDTENSLKYMVSEIDKKNLYQYYPFFIYYLYIYIY